MRLYVDYHELKLMAANDGELPPTSRNNSTPYWIYWLDVRGGPASLWDIMNNQYPVAETIKLELALWILQLLSLNGGLDEDITGVPGAGAGV